MPAHLAHGAVESITIEAVVTRADGSVEDLGTVARYDRKRSLLRRALDRLRGVGTVTFESEAR